MKNIGIHRLATAFVILLLTACSSGGGGDPVIINAGNGLIPDSGQTSCYYDYTNDNIYLPTESICLNPGSGWSPDGQDGYYAINTMQFTDNSDATIVDTITDLRWQKCSAGRSGSDCLTGTVNSYTWSDANSYCANLNLAGTGWRLPTIIELTRIVDYGNSYSTIDSIAFPATGASAYWSSSEHHNQVWAWYVNFSQGQTQANYPTETYYVRCVRG